MNPFQDQALCAALASVCSKWRGTPFMANQCTRGGVDCVRWVDAVYRSVGVLQTPIQFPDYPVTRGGPQALATLRGVLDSIPELKTAWRAESGAPRPCFDRGDMLLFSTGKAMTHLGVLTGWPVFWHAHLDDGVTEGNLTDPLYERSLRDVYRFHQ